MKGFAEAVVALAAYASTLVLVHADAIQPVCGLNCWVPPNLGVSNNGTFCANAWNDDGKGFQCIQVGDDEHSFVATSEWTSVPMNTRSYPHVKFGSPLFPYLVKNITALNLTAEWALSPTNQSAVGVDDVGLTKVECVGNVALDIWADADPHLAAKETLAGIEIMIWLGVFGPAWPLGWDKKETRFRKQVGDYNFTLYVGTGPKGQDVFTWVPDSNYTVINHEFVPLLQHLWETGLVDGNAYIGIVSFGTEMFFSTEPVTFSAKSLHMGIFDGRPLPSAGSSWRQLGSVSWLSGLSGSILIPFIISLMY